MKRISLVTFSYNRSGFLHNAISYFYKNCDIPPSDIELIISDDGSSHEHIEAIKKIALKFNADKLLLHEHGGLGYNQNCGIKEASCPYIFHLQDDFALMNESKGKNIINVGIKILDTHEDIDLVCFRYDNEPESIGYYDGEIGYLTTIDGIDIKRMCGGLFTYSDGPHLKRSNFHQKYGYYEEKGSSTKDCEMAEREFNNRCNKAKMQAAYVGQHFKHFGGESTLKHLWTKPHYDLYGERPNRLYQ